MEDVSIIYTFLPVNMFKEGGKHTIKFLTG